jgi:hypothetical protein
METFGQFLVRRFHEMAIRYPGKFKSQVEFGKWLGAKQSTFSTWVTDSKTPVEMKVIDEIAGKLGVEVYDILGVSRRLPKEKRLNFLASIWDKLPDEIKDQWYQTGLEIKEQEVGQERSRTS